MTKAPLTDKELVLIAFLHDFFHVNHQLPNLRLTAEAMKWVSESTAAYHLAKLEDKGYIERNALKHYRFTNGRATVMFQGAGL